MLLLWTLVIDFSNTLSIINKWILIMFSGTKSIHILFLLFSFAFYWSSSCRYSANVAINNAYLWDLKKQVELLN